MFDRLGISYQDLSFFSEIEVVGKRLDIRFSGIEESLMTFNPPEYLNVRDIIIESSEYGYYTDELRLLKRK